MQKLVIVVPMYNEQEMVPLFFERINAVIAQIQNYRVSVLCVDDGSKDATLAELKAQREKQTNLHIVSLSRNFGHESAVAAGLKRADGDCVVVMDADLQDPPELMLDMLRLYEQGYEVVNAKRVNRKKDPFLKRITAEGFYFVIGKLAGKIKVPNNVGNYRLMSRRVVAYVNELTEKNHVFRIQVPFVGFSTAEVEFVRPKRVKGQTHYNYKSMIKLAGDSITSSSIEPLRWAFNLGAFLGAVSFLCLIVFIVLQAVGVFASALGYLLIALSFLTLLTSVVLIALGIVGEYVGRSLIESQNRPLFYIGEEIQDGEDMKKR